jgi:hypothetical protein
MASIREDMIRMESKLDAILTAQEKFVEVQNKHETTLQEHHKRSLSLEMIVETVQKEYKILAANQSKLDDHVERCPARQETAFKRNLFDKFKTWFFVVTSLVVLYKGMNWQFLDNLFRPDTNTTTTSKN